MLKIFENELTLIFPEVYCTIAALTLLVYGVVYSTSKTYNYPILSRNVAYLVILSLCIEFLIIINQSTGSDIILNGSLIVDNLSLFSKGIILLGAILSLLMSISYLKDKKFNSFEYSVLIMLATLGMTLLVSSYDLISMYLAIELQSLVLYVLAAYNRNSQYSVEAGLKYFVLGAFSSGILLFGMSLVYGFTGSINFEDLAKLCVNLGYEGSSYNTGVTIGLTLIIIGLLFKLYAVPFHIWVPDIYEGSPTIVTAFFALAPSMSILGIFIRILMTTFYDFIDSWQQILVFCSIASMILGSLVALKQSKIKRLLAYSAIGHAGYILIGVSSGTPEGIKAVLLYVIIYIFMTAGIFSVLLSSRYLSSLHQIRYISDLKLLSKSNPVLAVTLSILLFSLAGIPPLAGFFSKLYVFLSAVKVSLYIPVLVGIITSVISSVYYLRIIQNMYFEKSSYIPSFVKIDALKSYILSISLFFICFFFVYPSPIIIMVHKASISLCI